MRAVGYTRVSTTEQAEQGVSLAAQRARIVAYCKAMELDLIAVYEDAGASASTLARPGLQTALEELSCHEVDVLVVAKLDRLTRSVRDLGDLLDKHFGATSDKGLMSVADSLDTRSATGRLIMNILASVSQWEREAIGERTRDALAHLRSNGVQLGGDRYGEARVLGADGRRTARRFDPLEVETIARMRELRESGYTWRATAAKLNAEGRRTKGGKRWHGNSCRRIVGRLDGEGGLDA